MAAQLLPCGLDYFYSWTRKRLNCPPPHFTGKRFLSGPGSRSPGLSKRKAQLLGSNQTATQFTPPVHMREWGKQRSSKIPCTFVAKARKLENDFFFLQMSGMVENERSLCNFPRKPCGCDLNSTQSLHSGDAAHFFAARQPTL